MFLMERSLTQDFLSTVVKTSPSTGRGVGLTRGQQAKIPTYLGAKKTKA